MKADLRITTQLIMIEVLGTGFFLLLLGACILICRKFTRKSLKECTVLITNGDSELSHELSHQLSHNHNCHVILTTGNAAATTNVCVGENNNNNSINYVNSAITKYPCDILNNAELAKLAQYIDDNFGGVDLVIDNGHALTPTEPNDCMHFIDQTSNGIRSMINLLMHFVPKMKHSVRGHFVCIQSNSNATKSFNSTNAEINTFLQHLTVDFPTANGILPDNEPQISSVIIQQQPKSLLPQANRDSNVIFNSNTINNWKEIASTIIDGIQYQRTNIEFSNKRSLIGYIYEYIRIK